MVWSGVTKNIKSICNKGRCVEFPNLGIFVPLRDENLDDSESASTKLTMKALENINKPENRETRLILNQVFLNQLGDYACVQQENRYIGSYDPIDA
jgi:hypothetical protein